MIQPRLLTLALASWILQAGTPAQAEPTWTADAAGYWPQWRGPLANGSAPKANPPTTWNETKNILWKTAIPGKGHSSPIVWSNKVYVLTAAPVGDALPPVHDKAPGVHDSIPVTHRHAYQVLALDRKSGRVVWNKTVREEFPHEGGHVTGSPASNSPITDGQRLYANFGSRGLFALDLDGHLLWQKQLGKMQTLHAHGEGSSPALHGNLLIVNWDHEGGSFIQAFDKVSGESRWKTVREEKTSWATPIVVEVEGKSQVIVSATKKIRAYDANTGVLIWECAGLTDNVVSSPIYTDGLLISGNSYYQQAMLAIRLKGARGDISDSDQVVWKINRLTPYVSSPLLYEGTLIFLRHNQNILLQMNPQNGSYRKEPLRLEGIQDFIFSSPVAASGRIYVTGRDGRTVVLEAAGENKVLSVNQLQDSFSASAALVDREIYLRGEHFLYCLAEPLEITDAQK